MDYWLKENKKFLISVGAIALATLLYYLFVLWPIGSGAEREGKARLDLIRAHRAGTAAGVPSASDVERAEAELRELRKRLDAQARRLQVALPEKFTGKGGYASYREQFDAIKLDVRDDLAQKNGQAGLGEFPQSLGFESLTIDGEEPAKEALLRLGVADAAVRIAIAAMKAGDRFVQIDISGPPGEEGDVFLRRAPVRLRVAGALKSLFRIVHEYQREPFLCVRSLSISGSAQEAFEAEILVAGLLVDPAKPIVAARSPE